LKNSTAYYPQGYFKTKSGEIEPPEKNKNYVIGLSNLGKYLIAWHSQRPNISYTAASRTFSPIEKETSPSSKQKGRARTSDAPKPS